MNPLSFPQQVRAISLLTEGNSIRATERLTGVTAYFEPGISRLPQPSAAYLSKTACPNFTGRVYAARVRFACLQAEPKSHKEDCENESNRIPIEPCPKRRGTGL